MQSDTCCLNKVVFQKASGRTAFGLRANNVEKKVLFSDVLLKKTRVDLRSAQSFMTSVTLPRLCGRLANKYLALLGSIEQDGTTHLSPLWVNNRCCPVPVSTGWEQDAQFLSSHGRLPLNRCRPVPVFTCKGPGTYRCRPVVGLSCVIFPV